MINAVILEIKNFLCMIHAQGCITTVKQTLEDAVTPLLLAWGVIGVAVALTELCVAFICFLFIQHSKRNLNIGINTPRKISEGKIN